jgi:hypothetical protein
MSGVNNVDFGRKKASFLHYIAPVQDKWYFANFPVDVTGGIGLDLKTG